MALSKTLKVFLQDLWGLLQAWHSFSLGHGSRIFSRPGCLISFRKNIFISFRDTYTEGLLDRNSSTEASPLTCRQSRSQSTKPGWTR